MKALYFIFAHMGLEMQAGEFPNYFVIAAPAAVFRGRGDHQCAAENRLLPFSFPERKGHKSDGTAADKADQGRFLR